MRKTGQVNTGKQKTEDSIKESILFSTQQMKVAKLVEWRQMDEDKIEENIEYRTEKCWRRIGCKWKERRTFRCQHGEIAWMIVPVTVEGRTGCLRDLIS